MRLQIKVVRIILLLLMANYTNTNNSHLYTEKKNVSRIHLSDFIGMV